MGENQNRIHSLDGLRGLFALILVVFHADNNTFLTNNFIVRNAFLFVDYFFVLSGFVISYRYLNRIVDMASFRDYVLRRFRRLYPLLLFTVAVYLLISIFGKYFGLLNFPGSYSLLIRMSVDSLTFMNSTPVFGSTMGANYPSWSISAEMISYVIFGVLVVLCGRRRLLLAATGLMMLAIIFFIVTGHYNYIGDYGFIRGAFCFLLGYLVYELHNKVAISFSSASELLVIVLVLLGFYLVFSYRNEILQALIPFLFAVGILIYAKGNGLVNKMLCSRPFQFIGKISYSVYLNHAIVLIVLDRVFFGAGNRSKSSLTLNTGYLAGALLITIVYSYFTFRFVERPTNKYRARGVFVPLPPT